MIAAAAVLLFILVGLYLASRPNMAPIQGMVETDTYIVATKAPARVEKLLAEEGQVVTAGQVLALLSSPEINARDQQAAAALQSAEALRQISREGARIEDRRSVEAVWQASQAAAILAGKTARRAENLFAEGVISAQRRDEAVAARIASAAHAEAARQQYLKLAAGTRPEDRAIADSQVAITRAGVAEIESLKSETRLTSPISGEVADRFANPGELTLIGVPIFTVIDIENAWVSVSIREDQFSGIRTGAIIRGDIPALKRHNVAFRITHVSPQGDFATWRATRQSRGYDVRSFEVRARPTSRVEGLRPGMSILFNWLPG